MKIRYLQISNVLSFRHYPNVSDAQRIEFDDSLNIVIGENGSGKSTVLEVINFIFKRVLYKQYNVDQDLFSRRSQIDQNERRNILQPANNRNFGEFRLNPNWDFEENDQVIPASIDQNPFAHFRVAMDMIFQG